MKLVYFLAKFSMIVALFSACSDVVEEPSSIMNQVADQENPMAIFDAKEDGRLWKSNTDTTKIFVYDGENWRYANEVEIAVGQGCVNSLIGNFSSDGIEEYVCTLSDINGNGVWKRAKIEDYPREMYFKKNMEYNTVLDNRDGQVYKVVVIDGKIWMAENLSYDTKDEYFQSCSSLGCEYSWNVAMAYSKEDSNVVNQGVCMAGWHVPDTTEWNDLLAAYGLLGLLSEIGWSLGNNETGLSLVPYHYDPRLNTSTLADGPTSRYAYLTIVTSNRQQGSLGYALIVGDGSAYFDYMGSSKNCALCRDYEKGVVRCVKD